MTLADTCDACWDDVASSETSITASGDVISTSPSPSPSTTTGIPSGVLSTLDPMSSSGPGRGGGGGSPSAAACRQTAIPEATVIALARLASAMPDYDQ